MKRNNNTQLGVAKCTISARLSYKTDEPIIMLSFYLSSTNDVIFLERSDKCFY